MVLISHEKVALHVTKGVRWDSDHVVLFDDETKEIAKEIVHHDALFCIQKNPQNKMFQGFSSFYC